MISNSGSNPSPLSGADTSSSPLSDSVVSSSTLQPSPTDNPPLTQNQLDWRLTAWTQNDQAVLLVPGVEVSLSFGQGQIGGLGGCNQYTGSYHAEGDRIVVNHLHTTRRACDGLIMEQEMKFFAALQEVHHMTLKANERLTLTYGEGSAVGSLIFSPW